MKTLLFALVLACTEACSPLCSRLNIQQAQESAQWVCTAPEGCVYRLRVNSVGEAYVGGPVSPLGTLPLTYHHITMKELVAWDEFSGLALALTFQEPQFEALVAAAREETLGAYARAAKKLKRQCPNTYNKASLEIIGQHILEHVFETRSVYARLRIAYYDALAETVPAKSETQQR